MIVEFEKVNAPGHRAVAGFYYYSGLCNHATVQAQRLQVPSCSTLTVLVLLSSMPASRRKETGAQEGRQHPIP